MCEARLRGVEERVRGVPPARRRREAERVRHELGAVVEREAGIFCEIPGKICGEFALISSARRARRRECGLRHAQEVRDAAAEDSRVRVAQARRVGALAAAATAAKRTRRFIRESLVAPSFCGILSTRGAS